MKKQYIGDSVYVEVENGMLKLTTDNGYGASNTIYLEPQVMEALIKYYDQAVRLTAEAREGES